MKLSSTVARLVGVSALLALGIAPALAADDTVSTSPVTAAIADLQKTLTGMGYSIGDSGKDWFSFDAGTYHVTTDLSGDASRIFFEVRYDLANDKMTKMPSMKALEWNGSHSDYFGYIKFNDGTSSWMLDASLPTAAATPKTLRAVIDTLVHDATTQQPLLDPSKW